MASTRELVRLGPCPPRANKPSLWRCARWPSCSLMNFRVEQGHINLFDFDACCAHFRAYEIATFLHVFGPLPPEPKRRVYDLLLDGYSRARPLEPELLLQIPRFAHLRLLYSFLVFAGEWGFEHLSPEQEAYFQLRRRLLAGPWIWPES